MYVDGIAKKAEQPAKERNFLPFVRGKDDCAPGQIAKDHRNIQHMDVVWGQHKGACRRDILFAFHLNAGQQPDDQ